jgi:RNA polymerase sigma-70 factor (ECF subfamily)
MMDDSELRTALEKHHHESYGWALSCCTRSSVEAEAVLQTVYLKVLAGQARYDDRASFKTWLFAVIRRTAADERRRQWLRRLLLEARPAPLAPAAIVRPDEAFERAELRRRLRDVLAQLPPRQREVLQLVFYHDLSLAEAAQVMGVALGTARTHYERGKQRCRARMKELQIHDHTGDDTGDETSDETGTGRTAPQRIVSVTEAGR